MYKAVFLRKAWLEVGYMKVLYFNLFCTHVTLNFSTGIFSQIHIYADNAQLHCFNKKPNVRKQGQ